MELNELALEFATRLCILGATEVEILDVSNKSEMAQYILVSSAKDSVNAKTICEKFVEYFLGQGIESSHIDGYILGDWIIIDYNKILINILLPEQREKYNLEKFWRDGKNSTQVELPKEKKVSKKTKK